MISAWTATMTAIIAMTSPNPAPSGTFAAQAKAPMANLAPTMARNSPTVRTVPRRITRPSGSTQIGVSSPRAMPTTALSSTLAANRLDAS
jgi:hypothetical protein